MFTASDSAADATATTEPKPFINYFLPTHLHKPVGL
jgi:hypothetical protein